MSIARSRRSRCRPARSCSTPAAAPARCCSARSSATRRGAGWASTSTPTRSRRPAPARPSACPGRDVRFEVRDAGEVTGRHDAVLNVGSSHVHGGYPAALRALRGLVAGGGTVVYGEGYWREPPSAAFLEALGGATEDELDNLGGLRSNVLSAGFDIASLTEAGEADWAAYEETLAANAERDGGPETAAYAERIRARRALPDGTRTLGFALLVLRAAGPRAGDG